MNRTTFLTFDYETRDFDVLDDMTGNKIRELVLVVRHRNNGRVRVQIRDSLGNQVWKNINRGFPYTEDLAKPCPNMPLSSGTAGAFFLLQR